MWQLVSVLLMKQEGFNTNGLCDMHSISALSVSLLLSAVAPAAHVFWQWMGQHHSMQSEQQTPGMMISDQ
jgi:hypothetical protein